jgi:penicillin-binding protein 1B
MAKMMMGAIQYGTATRMKSYGLQVETSAKTGTTNDFKDAWFVGFSSEILALIWVGYDDTEKVGLTGAAAALPLWVDFMKDARPFYQKKDFSRP